MPADDPYDLARFVDAQAPVYAQALDEIRSGRKKTHWMWFIFPQIAGLGHSAMAMKYAVGSLDEARAYLEHPVLGPRLLACARAAVGVEGKSADDVFGSPDDMKLRSSATLFAASPNADPVFEQLLARYFGGTPDEKTLQILRRLPPAGGRAR